MSLPHVFEQDVGNHEHNLGGRTTTGALLRQVARLLSCVCASMVTKHQRDNFLRSVCHSCAPVVDICVACSSLARRCW